jgi:hypothetical protein
LNTGTLIEHAGDLCDLNPKQSPAAIKRHKRFANTCVTELLNRAPYLFRSDERRYTVAPSLKPLADERILVDGDAWLLKLDSLDAAAIAQWRLDGTHATQSIYLQPDGGGAKVRRIIQGVANVGGEIFITITEPWANTTDTDLKWEVVTEDFYLPRDLKSVDAVRLTDATNSWYRDIRLIGEREGWNNVTGVINRLTSSNPWEAHPGGDLTLPTPRGLSASNTADGGALWNGFETNQTMEYYVTLCWGKRAEGAPRPESNTATAGRLRPIVQSEPMGPVTGVGISAAQSITLSLPDIDDLVAMESGTRSDPDLVGYFFAVYRAVEGYQPKLIAYVPAGTATWVDNGSTKPDFFYPLPRQGGCRALTFDATPADQVIVNGTWAPPKMVHNDDPVGVGDTGARALIELLVERIQRKMNNAAAASAARVRFETMLNDLSNEQSTGADPSRPRRRRTRRVGGSDGRYYPPNGRFATDWDWGN